MCNVRTFVTHEYGMRYFVSILMLHMKMLYGRTYVTHKNMISKCVCACFFFFFFFFFLHMTMCNVLFSFTFSEFGQMHIKMFQKLRESDSLVFKVWTGLGIASTDDK